MHLWQALFLGALQGIAELFPVSSLAQTILLPALLKWDFNREAPDYLAFVVALHFATALALLIYFWSDWKKVIAAFIGSAKRGRLIYDEASKFAWLLVAGTVVVGALGLVFEKKLRQLFEDPSKAWIVAAVLVLNGFVMMGADLLKKKASEKDAAIPSAVPAVGAPPVEIHSQELNGDAALDYESPPIANLTGQRRCVPDLTLIEGASIGATQTLALVPGISRSGVTIAAGLMAGLTYEEASRFSFMLATPVIGLARLLKIPTLLKPESRHILAMTIPSAIVSGICAYLSTKFLMRYFKNHRLAPFGWYCILIGIFSLVMLKH
jgi:undecaprenyl-diphosphatase